MEKETRGLKQIDWGTIVEFFTKRGRPLTKEEYNELVEEERREQEEKKEAKKREEEEERRRAADIIERNKVDDDEFEDEMPARFKEKKHVTILDDGYTSDPEIHQAKRNYDFYDENLRQVVLT